MLLFKTMTLFPTDKYFTFSRRAEKIVMTDFSHFDWIICFMHFINDNNRVDAGLVGTMIESKAQNHLMQHWFVDHVVYKSMLH